MINYSNNDVIVAPDGKWLDFKQPHPNYQKYYIEFVFNDATSGNKQALFGEVYANSTAVNITSYTLYKYDGTTTTGGEVLHPWDLGLVGTRGILNLDLDFTPDTITFTCRNPHDSTSDNISISLVGETNNVKTVLGSIIVRDLSEVPGMAPMVGTFGIQ